MAVVARAWLEQRGSRRRNKSECLERVVRTQTIPAGAGSIEADTAVWIGNWLANCVVGHARKLLGGIIIKHRLVQPRLRLGRTELRTAAYLPERIDGLTR